MIIPITATVPLVSVTSLCNALFADAQHLLPHTSIDFHHVSQVGFNGGSHSLCSHSHSSASSTLRAELMQRVLNMHTAYTQHADLLALQTDSDNRYSMPVQKQLIVEGQRGGRGRGGGGADLLGLKICYEHS